MGCEITENEARTALEYIIGKLQQGVPLCDIIDGHPYLYDILEWIIRHAAKAKAFEEAEKEEADLKASDTDAAEAERMRKAGS